MKRSISQIEKELFTAVPYIIANNQRLGVYDDLLNRLEENLKDWDEIYPKYKDVNQKTKVVVDQFSELRKRVEANLSEMKQFLKHKGDLVLTQADYDNLFINRDKESRMPVPVPKDQPLLTVVSQSRRTLRIQASISDLPDFNHQSILKKGIREVKIYVALRDPGDISVPTASEYISYAEFTTTTFNLVFSEADIQKTAYIKGALVNTKAEEGPVGEPINYVIPS